MFEVRKTDVYANRPNGLRDTRAQARVLVRVERLAAGNPGDVRPVGEGVSELRIDYGPGYRVYFKKQGLTVVILLAAGTNGPKAGTSRRPCASHETCKVDTMTKSVTSPYDVAEHLRTPEDMAAYLEASIEEAEGDAAFIAKALGDIARAKGMSQVACDAGLSRESLYKALSGDRNPSLGTVLKVVGALGLKLRAEAMSDPEVAGQSAAAHR